MLIFEVLELDLLYLYYDLKLTFPIQFISILLEKFCFWEINFSFKMIKNFEVLLYL